MAVVNPSAYEFRALHGRLSADPFEGTHEQGLSMRVVRLAPGETRKPHLHPHSSEAIYVVEGSGHFWENGTVHRVTAGDCILVGTGVAHATIPGEEMKLVCFLPRADLSSNTLELDDEIDPDDARMGG